jgi:uncharacterized membrane protein YkvA (DUF1232 family)
MKNKRATIPADPNKQLSFFSGLIKQLKLVWLLFKDDRVSLLTKSVLPLSLLYIISPIDFLPDFFLGLGQLDDLGVILLGMTLFVKLCPPELVNQYLDQLEYGDEFKNSGETVDTTYRVVGED